MNRPLLILDLDETLIWATDSDPGRQGDFRVAGYSVTKRPFLNEFLDYAFEDFDIAVWTSATGRYARPIVAEVFRGRARLKFVWLRHKCTPRLNPDTQQAFHLKDLRKVRRRGYDLERVLIVDDSPETARRNYGNLLQVAAFEGQADDRELADVIPFLRWIKDQPQFRSLEKRDWRTRRF